MAQFYAISAADIVGSMESLPFPPAFGVVGGSPNALFTAFTPFPPADYDIYNTDTGFLPTSKVTSFSQLASSVPFAVGAGQVEQVWKADSGDSYLLGTWARLASRAMTPCSA